MATTTPFRDKVEAKLNQSTESVRKEILDTKTHFMPLTVEILSNTIGLFFKGLKKDAEGNSDFLDRAAISVKLRSNIQDKINRIIPTKILRDDSGTLRTLNGKELTLTSVKVPVLAQVIDSKGNFIGILSNTDKEGYSAYERLRLGIFRYIESKIKVDSEPYKNMGYTPGADIGHTITSLENGDRLGTTPVQYQADIFKNLLDQEVKNNPAAIAILSKFNDLQRDFLKDTHAEYGDTVELYLDKDFRDNLISLKVNLVLPQDTLQNRWIFGIREKKFLEEITLLITQINFSRNIKEEVIHRVLAAIKDTKVVNTKSSLTLKPIKVKKAKIIPRTSLPKGTTKFNNAARNLSTGRFTSVTNLRNLLNFHLHDVVAANMGKGQPPSRILNFQTGRFATSTEVERVSITRQGEVQAFYNYMKNPYATFSEGGAQQFPRTRDPKLLISKSIRQIAEKMGINRMRAILV